MKIACIVYDGKNYPILECWESFTGWYWFILKRYDDPDVTFGYVVGFENEFGDIYMPELRVGHKKGSCWPVPQKNWFSISHVTMVESTENVIETRID